MYMYIYECIERERARVAHTLHTYAHAGMYVALHIRTYVCRCPCFSTHKQTLVYSYECFRLMISTIRLRKGSRYSGRKVWLAALEN